MQKWKCSKLFPVDKPHVPTAQEFHALLRVVSELKPADGGPEAGYTYLAQFIDHDVCFVLDNAEIPTIEDVVSHPPVVTSSLTLGRKPALDLDSVYGGGLADSIVPFDRDGKFVLGKTEHTDDRDFVRDFNFRPLIADPRNDDNLLVAQVQVLFMNLHNRIVGDLRKRGVTNPCELYAEARAAVIRIFQYVALHDFLPTLVSLDVYNKVIREGRGPLSSATPDDPTMPLEFSDAAFRLHPLVRSAYNLNDPLRGVSLGDLFERTGRHKRVGADDGPLLKREDEVDWRFFFAFKNYPAHSGRSQPAKQISPALSAPLHAVHVPGQAQPISLQQLNVLRGISRGLCTAQQAFDCVRERQPEVARELELELKDLTTDQLLKGVPRPNSLLTHTPLWLYLMLESEGDTLGTLGGWIMADTLLTAVKNADVQLERPSDPSPGSLHGPLVAMIENRKRLTIEDVIMFTYEYK